MEKYSASYTGTVNNFVIIGNDDGVKRAPVDSRIYSLYCVLQNLLQRARVTPPSSFLQSKLGAIPGGDKVPNSFYKLPLYLLASNTPNWEKRVLGNIDDDDYPAKIFFYELIDEYLHEYAFIKQLLLPEAKINEITEQNHPHFHEQAVDFYLPQARLIIEIDGSQHTGSAQMAKDYERDRHLESNGYTVVRIPAYSIKSRDYKLSQCMDMIRKSIRQRFGKSLPLYAYAYIAQYDAYYYSSQDVRLKYETVIRFQILLCSLLLSGKISADDTTWLIGILSDSTDLKTLMKIAAEDVLIWLENLFALADIPFERPKVKVSLDLGSENPDGLIVDFDLFKRYDDSDSKGGIIYVRNDYYDKSRPARANEDYRNKAYWESYSQYDFFRVTTAESINYDIPINSDGDVGRMDRLEFFLKELFGYDEFYNGQLPIIVSALNKKDTIGILPTGSGKSLCYQFCCLLQPTVNFVVAPIVSLMLDQKMNLLDEFGMDRAHYIASVQSKDEKAKVLSEFGAGRYSMIWISPERFQSQNFRDALDKLNKEYNFAYAVIDEVHCLSEWGHDFRVSYLHLTKTIRRYCPQATLIGLTATASQFVLEDIKVAFYDEQNHVEPQVKSPRSLDRPELHFHFQTTYDKNRSLATLLGRHGKGFEPVDGKYDDAGIVFTVYKGGRSGCIKLAEQFGKYLYDSKQTTSHKAVRCYHGNMTNTERMRVQEQFMNDEFPLLFATKAFGMGVNKRNVNYTVHYGMPWSIESFYQEAGRAGRGKKQDANCYVLYTPESSDEEMLIEKVFSHEIGIDELKNAIEAEAAPWKREHLKNDLGDVLGLWMMGLDSIEDDYRTMVDVMLKLKEGTSPEGECPIVCSSEDKNRLERALYRLTILGIVEDWTIPVWPFGERQGILLINPSMAGYTAETVRDHIIRYIERYDTAFSIHTGIVNREYAKYGDIIRAEDNTLDSYIKAFLNWIYFNITYTRRTSIRHIRDICENKRNLTNEQIKHFIELYLEVSELTVLLDAIVNEPFSIDHWQDALFPETIGDELDALKRVPLENERCERLFAALTRYVESYRDNPGLNYLIGMLTLRLSDIGNTEARERLGAAFDDTDTFDGYTDEDRERIFSMTLDFGFLMSDPRREKLAEIMIGRYPTRMKDVYRTLEDKYSLACCLDMSQSELNNTIEKILSSQR
jgi:ATP-dependent DNA helicase RecQ